MNESMQRDSEYKSVLVEKPFSLDCPHCKAPIIEAGKDFFKYRAKQYWTDGDVLHVNPCPSILVKSWYPTFEKGCCHKCTKPYLCLRFKGILAKVNNTFKDRYFLENGEMGAFTNYIVTTKHKKWVMSRFETKKGVMLDSILGLYPIPDSNFKDQVSACRARFSLENETDLLMLAGRYLFIDPAENKQK